MRTTVAALCNCVHSEEQARPFTLGRFFDPGQTGSLGATSETSTASKGEASNGRPVRRCMKP